MMPNSGAYLSAVIVYNRESNPTGQDLYIHFLSYLDLCKEK